MASVPVDWEVLWSKMNREFPSQIAFAKAVGVAPRTVWKALKPNARVALETLKAFAAALQLGNDYSELIAQSQRSSGEKKPLSDCEVPKFNSATVLRVGRLQAKTPQERKLVIGSLEMSQRILSKRIKPSLAECLESSVVVTPANDAHKDYPVLKDWTYNHFFQVSIVIVLDVSDGSRVISYDRIPRRGLPGNVHTTGLSILFTAHTTWNLYDGQTLLDMWLQIDDPSTAVTQFQAGPAPILLQLMKPKIDLLGEKCLIEPLGIISRDQRSEGFSRIYSQYVFAVRLTVREKNVDRFLKSIRAPGIMLFRTPNSIDPECHFCENNKANAMDIVAWRGLVGHAKAVSFQNAKFSRGFEVV